MFYVEDQLNPRWYIVWESSHKVSKDDVDKDGMGDIIMEQQYLNDIVPFVDLFDIEGENELAYMWANCEECGPNLLNGRC